MTPFVAEILGTFVLLLLGNGVVANVLLNDTKGNNGGWLMINMGWGFAVFAGVLVAPAFRGCDAKVADLSAVLKRSDFGVTAQITHQNDLVYAASHEMLPDSWLIRCVLHQRS